MFKLLKIQPFVNFNSTMFSKFVNMSLECYSQFMLERYNLAGRRKKGEYRGGGGGVGACFVCKCLCNKITAF